MVSKKILVALLGVVTSAAALPFARALPFAPRVQQQQPSAEDMKKMMEGAKKWTSPSAAHDRLKEFVGKWDLTATMMGRPAGKSKAEFVSILGGRFVKQEFDGQLMGMAYQGLGLIGYDNFKQAYVSTWIDSTNTYKLDSQGKFDQSGKALIFYGTMDEYLTGENDKEVKFVYRWKDADHFSFEIHDLAIGESNTMVIEIQYARAK
jgi:hypothetical protein